MKNIDPIIKNPVLSKADYVGSLYLMDEEGAWYPGGEDYTPAQYDAWHKTHMEALDRLCTLLERV